MPIYVFHLKVIPSKTENLGLLHEFFLQLMPQLIFQNCNIRRGYDAKKKTDQQNEKCMLCKLKRIEFLQKFIIPLISVFTTTDQDYKIVCIPQSFQTTQKKKKKSSSDTLSTSFKKNNSRVKPSACCFLCVIFNESPLTVSQLICCQSKRAVNCKMCKTRNGKQKV